MRSRDAGEARLWHFGAVLAVGFAAAAAGLVGLTWLAWALLHYPRIARPGPLSVHDSVGVLQLVFASVAGAGALVALIVAYRRQKIAEADSAHDRTRVFNERFTAIAAQLGDAQPAVRLAGVHAMAGLADDWQANRQTCIDVLCAYLRMPYEPEPGDDATVAERHAFQASRELRHTVMRVITAHLNGTAPVTWCGLNFDFTGVVFDGGTFDGAEFTGGQVRFDHAEFSGGTVSFARAKFTGGQVRFDHAEFSGGQVRFDHAEVTSGMVSFADALFTAGRASFARAKFSGGQVSFDGAKFTGGGVSFQGAQFTGSSVSFGMARFTDSQVGFPAAQFTSGTVSFDFAEFSGGTVDFLAANFAGAQVDFADAAFTGSAVDFRTARWRVPPRLPAWDSAPSGVLLPAARPST